MIPKKMPDKSEAQKNKLFFVIKYRVINEKPTAASPETKEQFELQASEYWNQGEKIPSPPSSKISLGRALPHKFFKNKFITINTFNRAEEKTKKAL